ncbi:MAG: T9SS type A sorting domain-containing protein [Lewinellaceae bacterium]|nr:T9SS type A sorting domain-containing protein [Lewinellaceae bacterium]
MEIFYHDTQAGKDILIQNNTFSTQLQDNLLIDNVGGEGKATVRNNFFSTPPFANDTFYAIEVQQAYAAEGMFIESNTINSSSAVARPGGILVNQSLEYCLIRDNSITVTSATGVVFGIGATNCKVDMEIIGNNVNGGSANSSSGICIVNVPDDLLLCCNTLDKSNDGLYVNSDLNTNSLIYNTVFGEHAFAALHYYNVTTSTGAPQINYGNDWSGASGLWDAYFDGSPAMANMVKYQVGSTNLPSGLSKVFVTSGVPSDWFAVLGNEGSCALSDISFCGQTPGRPEGPDGGGGGEGGRSQASASYDLSVYPNPADQILSVELPDGADATFRISLRDLPGRTVIQQDVVAGTASVSLSTAKLSPGIYVLEVLQGDRRVGIFRVLIQH